MSELTKQALRVDNNQSFPNNNAGLITPTALRTFNENMIDSLVDEIGYNQDSASFNNRIDALSGSVAVDTGSLLVTASFNDGTRNLTFTKGDSTTFSVNIPDITGSQLPSGLVSGSSQINYPGISNIPSGIVSGSSQITPLLPSGVVSGSTQVLGGTGIVSSSSQINYPQISNIPSGIVSGSSQVVGILDSVNTFTQSQQTYNTNNDTKWNNLGGQSGSFVTESETGSFARTNVNNVFGGTQTFDNIIVNGTASIAYIESVTGSAKVIGDAFIILNNDTPIERFAGIKVLDSGSPDTTASFQFDGATDDWFFEKEVSGSTEFGVALFGPEYTTLGNPTYLTPNRIPKAANNHHLNDTNISDDGSKVTINSNTDITGSLRLNGNQTITGSLNITGSQTLIGELTSSRLRVNSSTSLGGTLSVAFDTIMRGDLTIESLSPQLKLRDTGAGGFSKGYDVRVDTGSFEIYDDTHDRDVLSDFFDSASATHTTSLTSEKIVISGSSSVIILGNTGVTGSVNISGNITASLQEGFVLVGNASGRTSAIATSSIQSDVSGLVTTSSFNTYTSSVDSSLSNINAFTASQIGTNTQLLNASSSFESKFVVLGGQTGSFVTENETGSFATTGSNTFVGTQTITGSLVLTGSISTNINVISIVAQTASLDGSLGNTFILSLVSGSNTRLETTNLRPGQTINLLVSQSNPVGGTLTTAGNLLEPSGSEYSASQVANAQDLLTLATFVNPNVVYVAAVNNLI